MNKLQLFISVCLITTIAGCTNYQPVSRALKSSAANTPVISQQTPGNPERQITVRLQSGEIRFYGSISPFWPEEFVLNEGEVKQIRLYEKYQPLKHQNNYVDVWVVYSPGQFIFDANPYNWRSSNFGAWLELKAQSFQRFSNVSVTEQLSTTEAKDLSITIIRLL